MVGSPAVAGWIAHVAFWTLLFIGYVRSEIGMTGGVIFLALWIVGYIGSGYFPTGNLLFVPYVAVLDVALVFAVVKGDVRIG
jgi:hypothetical protein